MKTLSILTPVLPSLSRYLRVAADSVRQAKEVAPQIGWKIEWIVVIDGEGDVPDIEGADMVFRLARRSGVSVARNYALAQARGEWVFPLDADDEIDPAGMKAVLERIAADDVDWVSMNRLLMDDAKTPHWHTEPMKWEIGELATQWKAPFAFHPNSIIVRRRSALHIAGWPALPSNEDLGFVLMLSEHFPGRFMPQVMIRYRVWPGQTVADASYKYTKHDSFDIIAAVMNARRERHGQPLITRPPAGGAFGVLHQK